MCKVKVLAVKGQYQTLTAYRYIPTEKNVYTDPGNVNKMYIRIISNNTGHHKPYMRRILFIFSRYIIFSKMSV